MSTVAALPRSAASAPTRRAHDVPALLLMAASGFAGLGYQIVWTQQGTLWLGHEAAAVLAVVAAFFGGMSVGALWLGPSVERSRHPARWYAACEGTIALWSVVLALVLGPVGNRLLDLTGPQPTPAWQWAVALCGTFVLLLPATAAMGATLPAVERALAARHGGRGPIGGLYASNTAGAVLGVLATAFWLLPAFGLTRTAAVCAVLNVLCAITALVVLRAPDAPAATLRGDRPGAPPAPRRAVLARLACTGLLGIGYEVVVVRVLSQLAEDTVYTYALLLAVYLVGSAAGAAALQQWGRAAAARARPVDRTGGLIHAVAVACLAGGASLWAAASIQMALHAALGDGMAAALAGEAALAVVAFGLPTIAMGALFSHLATMARDSGIGVGRALGANTLGAAAAPLLIGVWGIPLLGPTTVLAGIVIGYLALASGGTALTPAARTGMAALAAATIGLAGWAPRLAFVDIPPGGHLLQYQDGATAAVSVTEDDDGVRRLRIDNRQQEGTSATRMVDARQALLPVLLHPAPRTALFLGLGTGTTARAAAADPGLHVDAVELLPEVITAARLFGDEGEPSRLRVVAGDARRYVRTTNRRYDVIVADNVHPARSGTGALYTVEHFQAVRSRLAEGGLFCQWVPLHQLDLDSLRSIVQSFLAAYPRGVAVLASNSLQTPVLGLVGRGERSAGYSVAAAERRLATSTFPTSPADVGLDDAYALLGSVVAGPGALARFAGNAALNTDDRPVVAYRAPRITYAPDSRPADRLLALLQTLSIDPADVVDGDSKDALRRLTAYWTARDRFLEAGRSVRPASDVQAMLSQTRGSLLSVIALSPDFRPAYDPLLRMARALAPQDPAAARELLGELARLQPARPEAASALLDLRPSFP